MNCNELFRITENGDHYIIDSYLERKNKDITSIEIPETYNGKPVTVIGSTAFYKAAYLEHIKFHNGLIDIGAMTFAECSSLQEAVLPNEIEFINCGAFEKCSALERVELPEGLKHIDKDAFGECLSLKEIVLPHSIQSLGRNAFGNCTSLENIVFPKDRKHIYIGAFLGTPKLPPEIILMGLIRRPDLSRQVKSLHDDELDSALRPDVFSLALKLGSFNNGDITEQLLFRIAERGPIEDFELAARAGLLDNAELTDNLLEHSARFQNAETAAWLLEYGRKKFGFGTEDKYEL